MNSYRLELTNGTFTKIRGINPIDALNRWEISLSDEEHEDLIIAMEPPFKVDGVPYFIDEDGDWTANPDANLQHADCGYVG